MTAKREKRCVLVAVSVTLVLCVFMFAVCTLSFDVNATSTNTLTTICDLNLRSSASTTSSVLVTIPQGATVTLLKNSSSGWANVKYSKYSGYCSTTYLNAVSDSGVTVTAKTTDEVNLRSGKGTSYSVLKVVPAKTTLTVKSNADEQWAKVTYSGSTGYVSKDYLTISFKVATVEENAATVAPTTAPTTTTTSTETMPEFKYANPDYSGLPDWYSYSLTDTLISDNGDSSPDLMLDKNSVKLDINETYRITPFVSKSLSVLGRVSYSSDNSNVATVSENGVVTAKSAGAAVISVTDSVTLITAKCVVTVSTNVIPTEPPTEKPTQAPTQKPTVTPTQKPTAAPTEKPTVAPTQPPTQKPTIAPTQPPTQKPTELKETLTLSQSEARLYVGTKHILIAQSNADVTWSTSDSAIATVDNEGIVTIKSAGTVVITAKTSTKSAKCTITALTQKISINASHSSASITAGKTFFARSTTDGVTWSSSDTSIATVSNGFIYGVAPGKAIIKIYKKGGTKTILVTVKNAAPIRFAYTSPNCAPKDSNVTLVAITDQTRTDVRFKVTVGTQTETVYATSKKSDGSNYIWKAEYKFTTAGTHDVKAYSKLGSKWTTCDDAATSAFVISATKLSTSVCEQRRASDNGINFIAGYEGYMPSVYDDILTGDPTLGYGKLVYVGDSFYNGLSKTEAYAYLAQTVNNDGYSSKVNSFLIDNNIKFNQQHFDALVSFVYNTGTGVLSNDSELKAALLDCSNGSDTTTKSYFINGSGVRIRKGPGTSYDIIDELSYGTSLTILEKTNTSWYYVQLTDGTKGYVSTDYIDSKTVTGALDLKYVNKQGVVDKFCQYHHANGCVRGLLNRRLDEMEVFFHNDYDLDYGSNNYNIKFTCAINSSFYA